MESLMKYMPFVDFLLKIDEKKYYKFSNIRKWILTKKLCAPAVVKKTEDAVLMQYKNLLLENKVKIPQSITDTFAPSIDLCSDDEDQYDQSNPAAKPEKNKHSNTKEEYSKSNLDVDDDLELVVGFDCFRKAGENNEKQPKKETGLNREDIDQTSKDILNRIDQLVADDSTRKGALYDPVNYTYQIGSEQDCAEDNKNDVFERRTTSSVSLFKRRTDFTADEVTVESLGDKNKVLFSSEKLLETISLDTDSESEAFNYDVHPSASRAVILSENNIMENINDDTRPSTSRAAILSEKNLMENTETSLAKPVSEVGKANPNSSSSNAIYSDKVEKLCDMIQSVLPELNELWNDDEAVNEVTACAKVPEESNKENTMQKNSTEAPKIDPVQVSKIIEAISSKIDFEIEYEALQYVEQVREIPETPPPAPPFIPPSPASCIAPPVPLLNEQQRTQILQPVSATSGNFAPTSLLPKPKINVNDPRIKKHLQVIKNSPIFHNLLKGDLQISLSHDTTVQQPTLNLNRNNTDTSNSVPNSSAVSTNNSPIAIGECGRSGSTNKATITYGEYKRRQKQLEMERKQEEERKSKSKARSEQAQLADCEKSTRKEVESILLSTLNPCKDKLVSLWEQQKKSEGKEQNEKQVNNAEKMKESSSEKQQKENIETNQIDKAKEVNVLVSSKSKKKKTKRRPDSEQKLNRIYNELNCTIKGFDQIRDYLADETNSADNEMQTRTNSSSAVEEADASERLMGLRRRSSMHALSAITEQLAVQSDCSDSKNDFSYSSPEDSLQSLPKRRKTIDEVIRPKHRAKTLRIINDESSSSDNEAETQKSIRERVASKVPIIKLHRLSSELIRKHTKRARQNSTTASKENASQSVKLRKTNEVAKSLQEPCHKMPKLKKYNNDCQMTERNTSFCVLCRSKPADLTNHYKARHKLESYVARLDWSDLEDLAVNTHFAILQPNTKNYRFDRYEVECPFCKEKIIDQFINLYNHYSVHTGEYAFQCSHCSLAKPYKPDIQSHILHSKACRTATTQVMYRYPPHAQCIYLHYCNICNFAQLNEANVLKHLREHHDRSKAVESNVQKCILAAMSNAPDTSRTKNSFSPLLAQNALDLMEGVTPSTKQAEPIDIPTASEFKFKVDDDDIPVNNEPCLEDEDVEGSTCEAMLSYMHREPAPPIPPMTVIHNLGAHFNGNGIPDITSSANPQPAPVRLHPAINIKSETLAKNEQCITSTTATCSQQKHSATGNVYLPYEKYRCYPPNAKYLGLFKCMTDDCFYSTDFTSDFITHLTEHSTDTLNPNEYLQCPYCNFTSDELITPTQLVEHVCINHAHLNFQCSKCCYRSCDASNVHLHQQMHHNAVLNACNIYKTSIGHHDSIENFNLDDKIEKNIFKISCKFCGKASFYHTQLLINHIKSVHNLTSSNSLNIYSCISCPYTVDNKNQLRFHVAAKHPEEKPLIYDHNLPVNNINQDYKSSKNIMNLSEPVPYVETEIKAEIDSITEESTLEDIKPNFEELLSINEETVKVRLRKFTAHTGVAPDSLYRCPEQSCGGFFSNVELWLRHMKVRHLALECQCPHCSTAMLLPLEQFPAHFEQHRRHTYICFYCSTTAPTELLAREHAAQMHSELAEIRFERVCFNLSYSYWILIQKELFPGREEFIAEYLTVLNDRLNELERNELKNLKQQWPLRKDISWLDDCLQNLPKRKVAHRCLMKGCEFRTLKDEKLYHHLNSMHTIAGTQFSCSKCSYHVEKCNSLDELFNHIYSHSQYHFICGACTFVALSQAEISTHIEEQHTARDVPVIHTFRTTAQMHHKIYIVFADDNLTFSTMKDCFCCPEKNMSGSVFNLHLKRYHNFVLTYYCEKCTNFAFKSLQEVKPHFEQFHNSAKFKVRCELAARIDLQVISINDFQIEILSPPVATANQALSSVTVKNEPEDAADSDGAIFIEDDDLVIENSLKAAQQKQAELPKLKCASFSKLLEPNVNATATSSTQPQQTEMPRIQCAAFSRLMTPPTNNTTFIPTQHLQTNALSLPMPVAPTLPLTSITSQRDLNTNPLMNNINNLTQVPAPTVQNNNNFVLLNGVVISPAAPNSNSRLINFHLNTNNLSLNNNFCNNLPNSSQYTVVRPQTSGNMSTVRPNNQEILNATNTPYLRMPQNYNCM